MARRRTSEAEAGHRTGRDVGDAADCDIEARGGDGVGGNDTKGTRAQAESGSPCETKGSNTGLKRGRRPLRAFQESHMGRLPTKQCAAWRCRREQYLRESGRHVDLIREGYASADDATKWTVVIGGRARGPLKRDLGTRLFLLKPRLDLHGQYKESNAPAECGQCAAGPQ